MAVHLIAILLYIGVFNDLAVGVDIVALGPSGVTHPVIRDVIRSGRGPVRATIGPTVDYPALVPLDLVQVINRALAPAVAADLVAADDAAVVELCFTGADSLVESVFGCFFVDAGLTTFDDFALELLAASPSLLFPQAATVIPANRHIPSVTSLCFIIVVTPYSFWPTPQAASPGIEMKALLFTL